MRVTLLSVLALACLASTGVEAQFHRRAHHRVHESSERSLEKKIESILSSPALPAFLERHPAIAERAVDVFSVALPEEQYESEESEDSEDVAEGDSADEVAAATGGGINLFQLRSQLMAKVSSAFPNFFHGVNIQPREALHQLVASCSDILSKVGLTVKQVEDAVMAKIEAMAARAHGGAAATRPLPQSRAPKRAAHKKAESADADEAEYDSNEMALVSAEADEADLGVLAAVGIAALGGTAVLTAAAGTLFLVVGGAFACDDGSSDLCKNYPWSVLGFH